MNHLSLDMNPTTDAEQQRGYAPKLLHIKFVALADALRNTIFVYTSTECLASWRVFKKFECISVICVYVTEVAWSNSVINSADATVAN